MYARGMSTREIQGHLEEIYKVEVSPTLISNVTEEVMEEVKSWQNRPLDAVYPIVYLDALVVKIREAGHVRLVSQREHAVVAGYEFSDCVGEDGATGNLPCRQRNIVFYDRRLSIFLRDNQIPVYV